MRIPRKIFYRGRRVFVKRVSDPTFCDDRVGDYSRRCIRLSAIQEREEKEISFLHELLHMVDYHLPESHIERIATRLYRVIKDNKLFSCSP